MSCYKSWNGRESVLASLLEQQYGEVTRDRVMSHLYSDQFKEKHGDFKRETDLPLDQIGQEPTFDWVQKNLLGDQVNYQLKAVEILSSDKAKQVFEKGKKANWDLNKILTELQIPKEQKQLILDLGITDREQIALELATKYSYTVEINTATQKGNNILDEGRFDVREFLEAGGTMEDLQSDNPTQHYSNLTVPGGTNYTENEIAIPGQLIEEKPQGVPVKEGVSELFDSNPELANIGTPEQYSEYLDTIFPDSQVKDIVYHGTNNPNFSGFGSDFSRAIHFGTLQAAKDRRSHTDFEFKNNAKFIPVLLNVKNPLKTKQDFNFEGDGLEFVDDPDFDFTKEEGHRLLITYLHNKGYNVYHPKGGVYRDGEILNNAGLDSVIYKNEREDKGNYSYAVFETEQIHILGSKQDIEGFKSFIKSNTKTVRKGAITPSIKGHAQFATNNGIGWFRSDDKVIGGEFIDTAMEYPEQFIDTYDLDENGEAIPTYNFPKETRGGTPTKTRRILEVQSDLFQKGRDRSNLIDKKPNESRDLIEQTPFEDTWQVSNSQIGVIESGFKTKEEAEKWLKTPDTDNKNQFLQLLNQGSNWVTFFVKSIIQDSAKKGYEKVLFPTGNTASKVEGHSTLEEFKKQKEDRIKELELEKSKGSTTITEDDPNELPDVGMPFRQRELQINDEINQLKQELERVEKEGFGALKPIYNFYENTVTNILKKQGYNPTEITDEYGNKWFEVDFAQQVNPFQQVLLNPEQSKVKRTDAIITRVDVKANPTTLYIFGDNNTRSGLGGQAKEMRGEPNTVGVSTKKYPGTKDEHFMTDTELDANKQVISSDIDKVLTEWNTGKYTSLHIPQIGVGKAALPTRAPKTWEFLQQELNRLETAVNGQSASSTPQSPSSSTILKVPEPTTRVRPGELSEKAYTDMKAYIKENWVEAAIANPDTTYTVGYTNPGDSKFADNTGFTQKQYAQMLDEIREEMGGLPENLQIPVLFKYEMNNNLARIAKSFPDLKTALFPIDPVVEAEMTAKMEVSTTDETGATTGFFLKKYGSSAQVDITDTLLEPMYATYIANKVKPPSVDTLFAKALAIVNQQAVTAETQALRDMWTDVKRSFSFPSKDPRISFMSLLLGEFSKRRYNIKPDVKAKLLNKYAKLKNEEPVLTDEDLDGEIDYVPEQIEDDQENTEESQSLDGEAAKGEATKDYSDSSFELDSRQTAGTRTQMWLSMQTKMEMVKYTVLTVPPPPGGFYPPDVIDITDAFPDPSKITLKQALDWKDKRIAHRTQGEEVKKILEDKYTIIPVRNTIGRKTLVSFEDLLGAILDVTASTPDLDLAKAIKLLTDSGNPNLMETAKRLQTADIQTQKEILKVVNLQYTPYKVVRVDLKKDRNGREFAQTKILDAQQYDQLKVQRNKWKEKQLISNVMKLRPDGSRVMDLKKTGQHWDAIKVLQILNNPPENVNLLTAWKEELDTLINASPYLAGITSEMLIADRDVKSKNKRSLQGKILQTLFAEHNIILSEEMVKDLVGQYFSRGVWTDKVSSLTKRSKLEGNWASQFKVNKDGKPGGIFSAFFAKAAGITNVHDIDPQQTEEQEQYVMENNPMVTENTTMNILARLYNKHTPGLHSNSHKTVEGKKVWDYSYKTSLSERVDELREDLQAFRNKYLETVFIGYQDQEGAIVSGNWYLDHVDFDKLSVGYFEGSNIGNRNTGTVRTNMSDREQLLSVLTGYFNNGKNVAHMMSLTHSDKTTTPIYSNVPKFSVGEPQEKGIGLDVQEKFYQMFKGELRRAQQVQKLLDTEGTTGNAKLDEGGTKFYFLPMFNIAELKKLGLDNFLYGEDGKLLTDFDESNKPMFMELIASFLSKEIELERKNWSDKGMTAELIDENYRKSLDKKLDSVEGFSTAAKIDKEGNKDLRTQRDTLIYDHAIKDFTLNSLYWNMSSAILFYGDPAQTTKKGVNETYAEYAKRLAKDIAPGQSLQFDRPNFNSLTVQDVSEVHKYLTDLGNKVGFVKEATNAQEITTVQEHLDVMQALGVISDTMYNTLTKRIVEAVDGYYEFTKEELDQMMQPMQPMKPVYTGFRDPSKGFMIYDYIKTSAYPLLPQFTKGMEMDKVRKMLEKDNIQRVAFISGVKMGAKSNLPTLFTEDGQFVEGNFTEYTQTLARKNFRIQQDVPFEKSKEAIKIVSQMNKLIVEGIEDLKDFNVPGYPELSGRGIRTLKEELKSKMLDMNLKKFMKEIGDSEGNVDKTKVIKMMVQEAKSRGYSTNEISLLERVIEYKDANGNIFGQDFDFPLFLHPAVEKFESLIMSMVKKVTEFKMPGKSYVQASSTGYTRGIVRQSEANIDNREMVWVEGYDGTQPLKHQSIVNGEVQPAQVLAPFNFFIKGKKQSVEDYLIPGTRQLDMTRVPRELLQLVGARIPNQGHNSMIAMEIVGFVPDWMGDTLIVPSPITEQMGSDFDVDKLYTYKRPYTFKDGIFTEEDTTERLGADDAEYQELKATAEQFLEDRGAERDEDGYYDEEMFNQYLGIAVDMKYPDGNVTKHTTSKPDEKKALQRDYFNVHWAVLTHPDMFNKVLDKLDKPDLKDANERFPAKGKESSFWSSRTQQEMFQAGKDAKMLVALTSLAVTFNSVIQNKDLRLGYYTEDEDGNITAHPQPVRVNGKDFLSLSGNGKNGDYTKHVNQTIFQSGAVDNAKDRTLDNLNITLATYPAIQAIHQLETKDGEILGTDFSTALMVQESIWKYSALIRQGNDSLSDEYTPKMAEAAYETLRAEYVTRYTTLTGKSEEELSVDLGRVEVSTKLLEDLWKQKDSNNVKSGEALYVLRQIAALDTFNRFTEIGLRLRELQKTLNQDTNGAGKNMLYANKQQDNYNNLYSIKNKIFIGESSLTDFSEQDTTFQAIIPTALHIADAVFPFQAMKHVVELVAQNKKTTLSDMSLTTQRDIIRHLRSAILSSSPLISQRPTAERFRLLYGSDSQPSLAVRLEKYKLEVINNYFLERLHTKINAFGKGPDTIEFVNAPAVRMDDELNVSDFMSLINSEDPEARELGQDLARYALLFTPQAGPGSFINKIPTAVLLGTNFSTDMRNITERLNKGDGLAGFTDQLYQHIPSLAMDLTEKDLESNLPINKIEGRTYPEIFTVDFGSEAVQKWRVTIGNMTQATPYLRFFDKVENRNILYKAQFGEGNIVQYQRIDTLGTKRQSEFDLNISGINRSVFQQNRAGLAFREVDIVFQNKNSLQQAITQTTDPDNAFSRWGLVENTGEEGLVEALRQLSNDPKVKTYLRTLGKAFAGEQNQKEAIKGLRAFKMNIQPFKLEFADKENSLGSYEPGSRLMTIKKTKNIADAADTLIHETIHHRTESVLIALGWGNEDLIATFSPEDRIWYDKVVNKFREEHKELYNKFKSLEMLRAQSYLELKKRLGEKSAQIEQDVKDGKPHTTAEHRVMYSVLTMSEFIVGVQTNKETMQFLNSVESKSGKSLVTRIVDAILEILADIAKVIGPINDNSVLKEALQLAYHVTNLETTKDMYTLEGAIKPGPIVTATEFEADLLANNTNGTVSSDGLSHTVKPFTSVDSRLSTSRHEMDFVLKKMDAEIRVLESLLGTPPRTEEDKARFNKITKLLQETMDDRDTISSTMEFTQLADIGNKQLTWVKELLAKDVLHVQEVKMATQILDTWYNLTDLYKKEFAVINHENEAMLFNLQNLTIPLFGELSRARARTVVSKASIKGMVVEESSFLTEVTDVAKHKQLLIALSRDGNRLSQFLSLFGQEAANNAQEAQTELAGDIDEMIELIGKDSSNYMKFIQETEDKSAFGLVQELSPKWYGHLREANRSLDDTLFDIRSKVPQYTINAVTGKKEKNPEYTRLHKATWKKFWDKWSKEGQAIPVGLLFDMETGERLEAEEEYNKLVEYSGSKAVVDKALEDTQITLKRFLAQKALKFKEFKETIKNVMPEDGEKLRERFTAEELLKTPEEQQALILSRLVSYREEKLRWAEMDWVHKNSPQNFLFTNSAIAVDETYTHNGRFKPAFIPKKGADTFDPKYTAIQADPKLKEAYEMMVRMSKLFRSYLPPKLTERMHDNFLPVIDIRDVATMYSMFQKMTSGPGKYIAEGILNSMSISEYEKNRKDSDEVPIKFVGNVPRVKDVDGKYTKEIDFSKVSIDLPRIFEMFGNMAIHYHYMNPINDLIDVVQRMVRDESNERENIGEKGLGNLKELIDYYRDMLVLKKPLALEGVAAQPVFYPSKVTIKGVKIDVKDRIVEARTRIEAINQEILDLPWDPFAGTGLSDEISEAEKTAELIKEREELQEEIDGYMDTARYITGSKIGDTMIGINQLKAMSYNPFSAVTNFTFGYMSSFIHARGFRADKEDGTTKGDFTDTQLRQAYSLMKGNALRSWTVGLSEGALAQKCKAIIDRVGMVEALIDTTYGKTNLKAHGKSQLRKTLDPFAWQKSGDFMTKGAVVIAMTLNKKVKVTKDGIEQEIPLFEALDSEGKWDAEKYGPNEDWYSSTDKDIKQQEWNKLRDKIRKVGLIIFGNQDKNVPLMLRGTIVGRLVGQFRASWMSEGVNTRFGKEYYDEQLGRKVSGRYLTLTKMKGYGIPMLLQQVASVFTGDNVFEGVETLQTNSKGEQVWRPIQDHEIENMRKNLAGMAYTLAVMAAGIMLKATLPDDEEMKKRRRQGKDNSTGTRMLINTLYRMRQDLTLYANPFIADQVLGNIVPSWNVAKDGLNAVMATAAIGFKEDPDMEKFFLKWTKVFPYLNLVNKLKFYSERDISSAVR